MKKCAAGLAALFLIVIFLSPRAFAAGYELPEGTSITAQSAYFVNLDTASWCLNKTRTSSEAWPA